MRKTVTAVLIAAAAIVGAEPIGAQRQSTIIERVLVRVNGEVMTQSDLTQHQADVLRERNRQSRAVPDAELVKLLNEITPGILVEAVDQLLIVQHGRELGSPFTDTEFQKGLETIRKENNLNEAQLKQALIDEGLTLEELRKNFERAWMLQVVQSKEIFPRMRITEEELRQYFNANRGQFVTPPTVTLREISVMAPSQAGQDAMSPFQAAAAKSRIDAIHQRAVVAGADFVALVKEASDSATKANGGLIGPLKLSDLNPAIKGTLEKLQPGEITEPIALPRGYQILKLESRSGSEPQPFDKVRDDILLSIRNERLGGEMAKLKTRLRTEAVIEWKDDNLRQLYQKQLGIRAAQ